MNTTLEHHLRQAEGRYFTDLELKAFETFRQTYALRQTTYRLLTEKSDALVMAALRALAQSEPETVRQHQDTCKRDMSYVVRSMALALLKDDTQSFQEQLVLWMQNIMAALRKEAQSVKAYRLLQQAINEQLPAENAALISQYLSLFIDALGTLADARSY